VPHHPSSAASSTSPRATLTVEQDGARLTFRIDGAVTVGREPGCDVLLSSPTVSRRHALVAPTGDGWIVRDLGSGNGTFLDARRVDEARLPNGVAIRFGSVPAWFEEEPEAPLTASQRIQRTLTQTLSIQPAKRTRKKAAVAAIAGGVALLVGASVYRGCSSHAAGAVPPEAPPRPAAAENARN
jgi:pSer/pThr/pTyr-binding forkhead associated (FHA) protein